VPSGREVGFSAARVPSGRVVYLGVTFIVEAVLLSRWFHSRHDRYGRSPQNGGYSTKAIGAE
jgi:hypothetical protein